jgi:hypothetical protein
MDSTPKPNTHGVTNWNDVPPGAPRFSPVIQGELDHLKELRARVQTGLDSGEVDLESGTAMLVRIAEARSRLMGF